MDAIRFDPGISTDLLVDRRPGGAGSGGDMFADMLGEQLKKRSESERGETAIRRRQPVTRRSDAESPATHGRPIRAVVKHPHTLRGEAKPVDDGQKAIEVRKKDDEAAASCAEDAPSITAEAPDQGSEDPAPQAEQGKQAEPVAAAAPDGPALQVAVVQVPATGARTIFTDGEAATPAPDAAAADDAAPVQPATAETSGDTVPNMAGFAAALAASQAETAAAIGTDEGNVPPAGAAPALSDAALAALAGTPNPAAPAAEAGTEPPAETAELTIKLTPDAPRTTEAAKPRPSSRPAPAAEIRPQQSALAPAPQAAATIQPAALPTGSASAESTTAAFDTAIDGDGATVPGWALHLAQGTASKRPDFIAQLRQHLQDLPAHEQVAVNIQRAIREGTGRLSIQLSPAELGQIHVKLEIDEEKRVTAAVTVEKPSTLELLQRDVKALERALHDAGLKMDGNDLSFSLGRQDSQEFARDMRQSDPSMRGQGTAVGEANSALPVAAQEAVDTASGLVNVEV